MYVIILSSVTGFLYFSIAVPLYDLLEAGIKSVPSLSAVKYTNEDIVEMNFIHFNFGEKINVFPGVEEVCTSKNYHNS